MKIYWRNKQGNKNGCFEIDLTGEGICWTGEFKGQRYLFKTKGEKHSVTKTKTLIPVCPEKAASIKDFLDKTVTQNRLEQAIEMVFTSNGETPEMKGFGKVLSWMVNDIIEEEKEVIKESKLEIKDVKKAIPQRVKAWFWEQGYA